MNSKILHQTTEIEEQNKMNSNYLGLNFVRDGKCENMDIKDMKVYVNMFKTFLKNRFGMGREILILKLIFA